MAWKILRGEAVPELGLAVENSSESEDSEYVTVDVTVYASDYVASGVTLHLGCRTVNDNCFSLRNAFLPDRSWVSREDALKILHPVTSAKGMVSLGEIEPDSPKRVQFIFLREDVRTGSALQVTATSWNSKAASQDIILSVEEDQPLDEIFVPENDSFSNPKRIRSTMGKFPLDFAMASREPGEPLVSASSRTLWYTWKAPHRGLFRFKLNDANSSETANGNIDFALFTGDKLVDLELETEKRGGEISFAAPAGAEYKLRIATRDWDLPPLTLEWESADARPANDDFANAQAVEGESGSFGSSNEGATLEGSEFYGGSAASVWFEWTAPEDGPWIFKTTQGFSLSTRIYTGSSIETLRLVSQPGVNSVFARFVARKGETYKISTTSRSADSSGLKFELSWRPVEDYDVSTYFPMSDHFANAKEIEGMEGSAIVSGRADDYLGLTVEPYEPIATGIGTAWLQWTAPADRRFTWKLSGHSSQQLSIFIGDALSSLQLVGSIQGDSSFTLDANRNTSYWIAAGQSASSLHSYSPTSFKVEWGPTPSNDSRNSASNISGGGGLTIARIAHSTTSPQDPKDTVGTDSVWWRWRAPESGWHRFWVERNPLSVILSIYPGDGSNQAVAMSERSFIANGRVEAFVLARAGQYYDVRLATRPGVEKVTTAVFRWVRSSAPAFLSYKGATLMDSLELDGIPQVLRSPLQLAMNSDGRFLASTAANGIFVFKRDEESNKLSLAYRSDTEATNALPTSGFLEYAQLWWNDRQSRLFAMTGSEGYSFAFSDDRSSEVSQERIAGYPGGRRSVWGWRKRKHGVGSLDGRYFFGLRNSDNEIRAYRVDSPAEFTLEQIVSSSVESDTYVEMLLVDKMRTPLDAVLPPDGSHLYVLAETGLFVFAVDPETGKLDLTKEILLTEDHSNSFQALRGLASIAIDRKGDLLFVSGPRNFGSSTGSPFDQPFLSNPVVAFDIATDPSNPRYLDSLTRNYAELNNDVYLSWSHLKPSYSFDRLRGCSSMISHGDLPAVDVFCNNGFFVATWNPDVFELELADFSITDERDQFGNTLPESLGSFTYGNVYRQLAQSPDGGHVYHATTVANDQTRDAIHFFERASAAGFNPESHSRGTGSSVPGPATTSFSRDSPDRLCNSAESSDDNANCRPNLGVAHTDNSSTDARFTGYVSTDQNLGAHAVLSPNQEISVVGIVHPAQSDQGKPGSVHIAAVLPGGEFFVRNTVGGWIPWNGDALPAAQSWDALPASIDLVVFGHGTQGYDTVEEPLEPTGKNLGITGGEIRFYLAYSTSDSGIYRYSAEPVTLTISGPGQSERSDEEC